MMKTISAPSLPWRKTALFIMMIVILTAAAAGCGKRECSHEWSEPTCMAPATCGLCGATEGGVGEHTYASNVCTGTVKCSLCEAVVLANGHDWGDASCLEPRLCSRCEAVEGEAAGHEYADGACRRCGEPEWKPLKEAGSGNKRVTNVILGADFYAMHILHEGAREFQVEMEDAAGGTALLVEASGPYDGTVLIYGASPMTFDISADGGWSYTIDKVETGDAVEFSGSGDSVTQAVPASSGSYHITHAGSGNFYVYAFSPGVVTPVVQPVRGRYDGNVELTLPDGGMTTFEVHASGAWSIQAVS